jgi:hypothetical protein
MTLIIVDPLLGLNVAQASNSTRFGKNTRFRACRRSDKLIHQL